MSDDLMSIEKAAIRMRSRAARRSIAPELRLEASLAIAERVLALPEMQDVKAVLVYGASPEEVEALPIEDARRARGVRIAYPKVVESGQLELHWIEDRRQLERGSFELLEPRADTERAPACDIDAIVVPGVAFDATCGRVGYGGGYYDALLSGPCDRVPAIGVAFDEQMVERIPREERDRRVDIVVTPTRTIRCTTSRT
ncbi:5-formyltetrahydrofolate cyclo-ligase [bacterium]|nr:5-formyltetrahydrofolate cyclo-ligase [bacterium]